MKLQKRTRNNSLHTAEKSLYKYSPPMLQYLSVMKNDNSKKGLSNCWIGFFRHIFGTILKLTILLDSSSDGNDAKCPFPI